MNQYSIMQNHTRKTFYLTLPHIFLLSIVANLFKKKTLLCLINPFAHIRNTIDFPFISIFISFLMHLFAEYSNEKDLTLKIQITPSFTITQNIPSIISKLLFMLYFIPSTLVQISFTRIVLISLTIIILNITEMYEKYLNKDQVILYRTEGLVPTFIKHLPFLLKKIAIEIRVRISTMVILYVLPQIFGIVNYWHFKSLHILLNLMVTILSVVFYVAFTNLIDFIFVYNFSLPEEEFKLDCTVLADTLKTTKKSVSGMTMENINTYERIFREQKNGNSLECDFTNIFRLHQIISNYETGYTLIKNKQVVQFLRKMLENGLEKIFSQISYYKEANKKVDRKRYYTIPIIMKPEILEEQKKQILKRVKSHNYLSVFITKLQVYFEKKMIIRKIKNELRWINEILLFINFVKKENERELIEDFYIELDKKFDILRAKIYEIDIESNFEQVERMCLLLKER